MVMLCDCYVIVLFELDQREWHAMAYYHNWRRKTAMMTGVLHGKENKAADAALPVMDVSDAYADAILRAKWVERNFPRFCKYPVYQYSISQYSQ